MIILYNLRFESLVNSSSGKTNFVSVATTVRLRALLIQVVVKQKRRYNVSTGGLRALLIQVVVKRLEGLNEYTSGLRALLIQVVVKQGRICMHGSNV